jgi:hypothetical protein
MRHAGLALGVSTARVTVQGNRHVVIGLNVSLCALQPQSNGVNSVCSSPSSPHHSCSTTTAGLLLGPASYPVAPDDPKLTFSMAADARADNPASRSCRDQMP